MSSWQHLLISEMPAGVGLEPHPTHSVHGRDVRLPPCRPSEVLCFSNTFYSGD